MINNLFPKMNEPYSNKFEQKSNLNYKNKPKLNKNEPRYKTKYLNFVLKKSELYSRRNYIQTCPTANSL